MGLDQYAYAAYERGERRRYWDNATFDKKTGEYKSQYKLPHEISYWRKHHRLQEWMSNLWQEKGKPHPEPTNSTTWWESMFNCVELELTWDDINRLEDDIKNGRNGFIKTCDYHQDDLKFCLDAKEQLFLFRKRVFYYPSW